MISAILLGTGNVANHLIDTFLQSKDVDLVQVYGRNSANLKLIRDKVCTTSEINQLKNADVYIIAISDDAIQEFSSQITIKNKLIVHTSGSVSMDALSFHKNRGVFYPLQTFTKNKPVNFKEIPICLETNRSENYKLLEQLAKSISNHVYNIDSNQRKYIHLAAVFTNNFVNYMYKIGNDICTENNIPFKILYPLILETAKKIKNNNPANIQTGPAVRNDTKTIEKQINLLNNQQQQIYKQLTQAIKNTYGKKL
ncbi:DUF2520 domain-containing protein [Aureibaculum marinum]|uniref:DUF2520 domain-containing protein n=1 Tax=Aureibaculum marinum TaxID=2487930 RepID=A0A3N4P187_9FLAO|nr:DUF2520 domain-containing protein [Aureibaculum marinum]RPD98756.1 DUF2520 domain-containing protein [Aureibaculum marinum]